MPVRGLTVIVASADAARFRSALELAATQAALGGRVRLFLQTPAIALIGAADADASHYAAAGLPTKADLIELCRELGVALILCQSGLALAGLDLSRLDASFEAGGLASLLADLNEDRLVAL